MALEHKLHKDGTLSIPRLKAALTRLRGCLHHIDWDATRLDVRARWGAWRDRLSA